MGLVRHWSRARDGSLTGLTASCGSTATGDNRWPNGAPRLTLGNHSTIAGLGAHDLMTIRARLALGILAIAVVLLIPLLRRFNRSSGWMRRLAPRRRGDRAARAASPRSGELEELAREQTASRRFVRRRRGRRGEHGRAARDGRYAGVGDVRQRGVSLQNVAQLYAGARTLFPPSARPAVDQSRRAGCLASATRIVENAAEETNRSRAVRVGARGRRDPRGRDRDLATLSIGRPLPHSRRNARRRRRQLRAPLRHRAGAP